MKILPSAWLVDHWPIAERVRTRSRAHVRACLLPDVLRSLEDSLRALSAHGDGHVDAQHGPLRFANDRLCKEEDIVDAYILEGATQQIRTEGVADRDDVDTGALEDAQHRHV